MKNKGKFKCGHCKRESDNLVNRMLALAYDKCKGKKCPDCGKVRKLGIVKIKDYSQGARTSCPKCKGQMIDFTFDGLCNKCFYDLNRDDCGCVTHGGAPGYYCSPCKGFIFEEYIVKIALAINDWL